VPDTVIENPILNSPFEEPSRHFLFGEDGITDKVVEKRRLSAYFMPIPESRRRRGQISMEAEWTADRIRPNEEINSIRAKVGAWRKEGHPGVTSTTRRLLDYWHQEDRERRLFFCQLEAVETAIYLAEVAGKAGDGWIRNMLEERSAEHNPGLFRIALKMATGTGKTVVMAMLIAWQALNKFADPRSRRFSDAFLLVAPGITIRDRLRVLLPEDGENYYRALDLLPPADREHLGEARIAIVNFHGFQLRDRGDGSKTTKSILAAGGKNPFVETPDQMVRRVCRELGSKRGIVVLNDEAHHCYRRQIDPDLEEVKMSGEERREAERRAGEARVWISGLEAVQRKLGIRTIYDLSATPFFLRGSGYAEGTLFPWTVSDFSLVDSIEAGVVKIPRVPVADDTDPTASPTYRDLWIRIRDDLPRRGRAATKLEGEPKLPVELEAALLSLYGDYERSYQRWRAGEETSPTGSTPPVFIVVCSNTAVSKLVFDYVAGWERQRDDGAATLIPGRLDLFSNVRDANWAPRPNTILVDSEQLESGEAMSREFKAVARAEIDRFKDEFRARNPGADVEAITDEQLLREVMNTVGKPGRLGEQVRCVVSVSMLTEGWDANTVTHILGVRAFGTQLLCEQVVGRGLRRRSHAVNDDGRFEPEYAEIYGVPFAFIPASGQTAEPKPGKSMTRVRALEERANLEMTFPRVVGYRHELATEHLRAEFAPSSKLTLSTDDVPSRTEIAGLIGDESIHTLEDLHDRREQEVVYFVADRLVRAYFPDRPWLFPQLTEIVREWMSTCLVLDDKTVPQLLMLHEHADSAVDRIYNAIVAAEKGDEGILAVLAPYEAHGSTRHVDFDTIKPTMPTDPNRCHISHVVADTDQWEQKAARSLEEMPEVIAYVKNERLGFTIPYMLNGESHDYTPDFLIRYDDDRGYDDPLNLVLEISAKGGGPKEQAERKRAKVETARVLWVPGINNLKTEGRWAFHECGDPWNLQNELRAQISAPESAPA
jgi:type III restriction enzyme